MILPAVCFVGEKRVPTATAVGSLGLSPVPGLKNNYYNDGWKFVPACGDDPEFLVRGDQVITIHRKEVDALSYLELR
jgi:hypothetical protein